MDIIQTFYKEINGILLKKIKGSTNVILTPIHVCRSTCSILWMTVLSKLLSNCLSFSVFWEYDKMILTCTWNFKKPKKQEGEASVIEAK